MTLRARSSGIPTRPLSAAAARGLESELAEGILAAVEVPDGVFDPLHVCLSFLATARGNGAIVLPHTVVEALVIRGSGVEGAIARDRMTGG